MRALIAPLTSLPLGLFNVLLLVARKYRSYRIYRLRGQTNEIIDKIYPIRLFYNLTNLFYKRRFKVIVCGFHGVGLSSFIMFLQSSGVRLNLVFAKNFLRMNVLRRSQNIVLDRYPVDLVARMVFSYPISFTFPNKPVGGGGGEGRAPHSGISSGATVFVLVRDPISVIKTLLNAQIVTVLSEIDPTGVRRLLSNILSNQLHEAIFFSSAIEVVKPLARQVNIIDCSDILGDKLVPTMNSVLNSIRDAIPDISTSGFSIEMERFGSMFVRCFPLLFTHDGIDFVVSPRFMLRVGAMSSVDSFSASLPRRSINCDFIVICHDLNDIGFECNLSLAVLKNDNYRSDFDIQEVMKVGTAKALSLYNRLMGSIVDEDFIINYLDESGLTTFMQSLILRETRYIREVRPDIFRRWGHCSTFLGLDR